MESFQSHGISLRSAAFDRFEVSEILMPQRLSLQEHRHDAAQICFVLEGEYEESWSERSRRLIPGSLLYRPAHLKHANQFKDDDVLTLLLSYRESPGRVRQTDAALLPAVLFGDLRVDLARELRRDDDSSWALEGLGLLIGERVSRWLAQGDAKPPEWLLEARWIIESRFASPINLATIADQVGIHRSTLAAGFRRWYRSSVGEELRRRRIREAIRMLRDTSLPISAIAIECGFHDQPHLSRTLQRTLGQTPGAIRSKGHSPPDG